MSDLPESALQAGTLLNSPLALSDATYRKKIIDWGYQQIEVEYPPDAVKAPLNLLRRKRAMMAWERVVRTNGVELRNLVAGQAVAQLQFELERYRANLLAEDAEQRRREATEFDYRIRSQEDDHATYRNHDLREKEMRTQHDLDERAADAASRRRQEELSHLTEQDLTSLVTKALIGGMGPSPGEQTIAATRLINDEIYRIRHDLSLDADDRHLQIKALLDSMPALLRNLRPQDV